MAPASSAIAAARLRAKAFSKSAFLYPFKGIVYFSTNTFLWPFLRSRLFPAILLSTVVLVNLFLWTFLPQAAFLAIFHGRHGALLNATFLVLGEGAAITALLFEAFFVDEALLNVFDAVLVAEGCEELVERARPIFPEVDRGVTPPGTASTEARNPRERLGKLTDRKAEYSPFSFRQIVEFILLLPMNLVPWVGVPGFLWFTGMRAGPLHHYRYFKLKKFNRKEKRLEVAKRRLGYTCFGSMALLLQLVPILSMVFLLTSAAGSALWVADIEREQNARLQASVEPDEPPPEYTEYVDDPV